jgi:HAE1 family hydrophobic/amphiphilic exporter-1
VGGGPAGTVNEGQGYVRIAPHEERVFSLARLARGIVTLDPLEAFRGNYTQRQVMQQIRTRLRKYKDLRVGVRNIQGFNIGGGNFEIDFVIRGPELEKLAEYANRLRDRSEELGLVDIDVTLKLDKPELRAEIDRDRAADLGIRTQDIAAALRLMVGGDEEVTLRRSARTMTSSSGWPKRIAPTPAPSSTCTCREATASWCAWTAS